MSCNMSEMPLSRVPDEFTWLERAGFQCYLRKGDSKGAKSTGQSMRKELYSSFKSLFFCGIFWCWWVTSQDQVIQKCVDTFLRLVRQTAV